MLGKLIKHEMKATARTFLPVYGATVAVALVTRLMMSFSQSNRSSAAIDMLAGLSMFLFTILVFASGVLTLVIMISRFHKNLLGEQGYLMLTLPVKPWQHIISKLLVSTVWMFASVLVTIISFMLIMSYRGMLGEIIRSMSMFFELISKSFNANDALVAFEFIILMIFGILFSSLMIYFSIALGHRSNKNRVAAGFGWYILICFVLQILGNTFVSVFPFDTIFMNATTNTIIHGSLWMGIMSMAIPAVFFFFGTNKILTNKLNLE